MVFLLISGETFLQVRSGRRLRRGGPVRAGEETTEILAAATDSHSGQFIELPDRCCDSVSVYRTSYCDNKSNAGMSFMIM